MSHEVKETAKFLFSMHDDRLEFLGKFSGEALLLDECLENELYTVKIVYLHKHLYVTSYKLLSSYMYFKTEGYKKVNNVARL